MTEKQLAQVLQFQQNEATESVVYKKLAGIEKDPENKKVLLQIADDEYRHYQMLENYTKKRPKVNKRKVMFYYIIARIFGVTFGLKLMEGGESKAQVKYGAFEEYPDIKQIAQDEEKHEKALIDILKEEKLDYMGSIVLGLNDALVELTGALAGFTLALNDPKLVALTGSITGIAAALSMGSSEYLSTRMEDGSKHALKASVYTGIAYLVTVVILIAPYLIFNNLYLSLSLTLSAAVAIIAAFNYYYSVVKEESFKRRFLEMALLSLSVAAISFGIGYLLKTFTGIDA